MQEPIPGKRFKLMVRLYCRYGLIKMAQNSRPELPAHRSHKTFPPGRAGKSWEAAHVMTLLEMTSEAHPCGGKVRRRMKLCLIAHGLALTDILRLQRFQIVPRGAGSDAAADYVRSRSRTESMFATRR